MIFFKKKEKENSYKLMMKLYLEAETFFLYSRLLFLAIRKNILFFKSFF